jgi:hypothetical protein
VTAKVFGLEMVSSFVAANPTAAVKHDQSRKVFGTLGSEQVKPTGFVVWGVGQVGEDFHVGDSGMAFGSFWVWPGLGSQDTEFILSKKLKNR